MIKILLVEDIELVRHCISQVLDNTEGLRIIAAANSGEQALSMARSQKPDVVLMDISMPGMGGLEATRRLNRLYPDVPVLILSIHKDGPFPSHLLNSGVAGYLHKGCKYEEMVEAIRKVHRGGRYISKDVAQSLALESGHECDRSPIDTLSKRELQVMQMLIEGGNIKHISEKLNLSPKTISTYRARILTKLRVSNDAELTRIAIQYGMV